MKRISVALLLVLLSSTAHARGYSFSIGGHAIHVEAGRYCRSLSCVSWSDSRPRRSHRDDDDAVATAPAKPATAPPACPPVAAPTVAAPLAPEATAPRAAPIAPQLAPVAPAPAVQPPVPSTMVVAAANMQPVVKPDNGKPKDKATVEATVTDKPVDPPDWAKDWSPPKDAPAPVKPAPVKAADKPVKAVVAHEDDSPLGDWQTKGKKGLVRIEKCGAALCGYLLNETTNTAGEIVLSNMKAKTDAQWDGDIYSRASGNTYHARMIFKQPDTLHVEACAIGRFFCSGNDWTRLPQPDAVVTARDLGASPKS